MGDLLCPFCETEITEDTQFCPICGEDVTDFVRKIRIERQNQAKASNAERQKESSGREIRTEREDNLHTQVWQDADIENKRKILNRFLIAFGFTLAASITGIIALMIGGFV